MENEATFLKWAAAGPLISWDMLGTAHLFQNKPNKVYDHHEDTKLFQDKFLNDKKVFKETLENLEKPFLEQEPQLVPIILKKLCDQKKAIKLLVVQNIPEIISLNRLLESV